MNTASPERRYMMERSDEVRRADSLYDRIRKLDRLNREKDERIKELEEFLNQLDMCEIRGESVLILKPSNIIFKDIRPKPTFSDSAIMLTCATHSTPELFLKIIKTILSKH